MGMKTRITNEKFAEENLNFDLSVEIAKEKGHKV